MSSVKQLFTDARRAGVPIVAIQSPDAKATIKTCLAAIEDNPKDRAPSIQWDFVRGYVPLSEDEHGEPVVVPDEHQSQADPGGAMAFAQQLPDETVVFVHNAQLFFGETGFEQAVINLRDTNANRRRTVVLLGNQMRLPATLVNDIVFIDEPFPGSDQIREIVKDVYEGAVGNLPEDDELDRAVAALTGLPAFQCEQLTAMSMTMDGLVLDDLWERKRQQIEMTPGLSVYRQGETFADIGGLGTVKKMLNRLITSKRGFNAVIWIDEIDKMMSGQGDLSGVNQDQLGVILKYMEDHKVRGVLLAGPPGTSKSLLAKATGNEAGVPTVSCDFGDMKGSLMGQSEGQLRAAFKVIESISNGQPLFIGTCNRIDGLDTALLRRFPLTYLVDMPSEEEKPSIWNIHLSNYELPLDSELPDDTNWAGADIHNCVEFASDFRITPKEASAMIVPVGERCRDEIERLRKNADGTILSASYPGHYKKDRVAVAKSGGRKMQK